MKSYYISKKIFIIIVIILVGQFSTKNFQAVEPDEILKNSDQELRARNISKNIRCMVCQNQSISRRAIFLFFTEISIHP